MCPKKVPHECVNLVSNLSLNLENRMTVCMGYPAMPPQVGEPENAAGGGRKSMQG